MLECRDCLSPAIRALVSYRPDGEPLVTAPVSAARTQFPVLTVLGSDASDPVPAALMVIPVVVPVQVNAHLG